MFCFLCARKASVVDAFAFSSSMARTTPTTVGNNHNHNYKYQHRQERSVVRLQNGVPESASASCAPDGNVDFDAVVDCIDELYPPKGLDQRIALSRKDGYWPFVSSGEDPPQEFVYGEFDILFLKETLERALEFLEPTTANDVVFCDLGSGTGRLVLASAALHPNWKLCRGIELLESIHAEAVSKLESCRPEETDKAALCSSLAPKDGGLSLPMAPVELENGSFADPYGSFFDANILFCFSSCLPVHARIELARSIGRQCLPGTIVITTEYKLPEGGVLDPLPDDPDYPSGTYKVELLDTFDGTCGAVGGTSTAYIQRVVQSVGTGQRRVQPSLPLSEIAFRAVQYAENENDPTVFLRGVSNQMAFLGFPESWRPKA